MHPLTDEQKARGGNGDLRLWMEYEAEKNRGPSEYRQTVAPEDKGKLRQAEMLNDSFLVSVFMIDLERWLDDEKTRIDNQQQA